uniref:TBC domain-containing protein kinase-like protein n=1 Tax=Ciona intestinalis TaxID=7719 RepID=UPI000180CFBB|nr:TBC domain-containing protein kinase-like protein [Ciona intestinalis]|eukprot:XP_002132164.1 TBC domain-containing protein kinase-like protein [Ciona intestinalis]
MSSLLGCMSFVTAALPHNQCGINGLPLTPNSITSLGLAQQLKTLKHENLCSYVDFRCGRHERIFAVSELYVDSVFNKITQPTELKQDDWRKYSLNIVHGVLNGLNYLNSKGYIQLNLEPKNILLNENGTPKLSGYGLHHMTDGGKLLSGPLGSLKYSSPEQILSCCYSEIPMATSSKSDVWSACIVLLELLHRELLWDSVENKSLVKRVLCLSANKSSHKNIEVLCQNFKENLSLNETDDVTKLIKVILENGLNVESSQRATPLQILNKLGKDLNLTNEQQPADTNGKFEKTVPSENTNPLMEMDSEEIWCLWNLAGGDMVAEVLRSVTTTPPIRTVPLFVTVHGDLYGLEPSPENLFNPGYKLLSLDTVESRLEVNTENISLIYPLLELKSPDVSHESAKLPLLIRENDFDYQVHRIALYRRLLLGYPYLRDKLLKEARIDIPPYCRGRVWAGLLDVKGDLEEQYINIDKDTPIVTDRQIAVDVPRCHQYDSMLCSPTAHEKLKRVLKAWLMSHPHLTYWQGLDSLCAVFVHLNFNDEPRAWASMSQFIDKYLHDFFLKDNSAIIQEYLVVFSHLLTFHDPLLSCHMQEIGFIPDLYAIPWFLTMFAHVFPLHKIFHLWDTLLLGNSSFPLCIGVAILQQLRGQLLQSDFNECILLFSDLPEIDIDGVVKKSIQVFCQSPKSSTFRVHAQKEEKCKRQTVSYYTEDYNTLPKTELSETAIPLSELKQEVCCRISADDLIQLCELKGSNNSKTPAKATKSGKPRIFIIDIRSSDEFSRGCVPGSFNFPLAPNKSIPQLVQMISKQSPKVVVVIGNKSTREDREFCFELLKEGLKGVCVLHGGIDILKPVGVLTVPSQ